VQPEKMTEKEIEEIAVKWRRDFHEHPETSYHEEKTAQRVADILREMGLEPTMAKKSHGVMATIEGGKRGPMIALRADMDALQVEEQVDVPWKSQNKGVMHACGHDFHMTILLTAALRLLQHKDSIPGKVRLIFQPSEEMTPDGGAKFILEEGFLEGCIAIFGLHVWPDFLCGQAGVKPGPLMAASDRFKIKVIGKTSHAGHPDQGVDAVMATADILQQISHIVSRRVNPLSTATINVGTLQAGSRYNVVPGEANMEGTIRTLDETARTNIPKFIKNILEGAKISTGIDYKMEYFYGYPVLNNWPVPAKLAADTIQKVLGKDALMKTEPHLTAEDFGVYLEKLPGAFLWLGCRKQGEPVYGLHSAKLCPDENTLHLGSKLMEQIALNALWALCNGVNFTKE
jgi:amidohydrolase